MTVGFRTNQSQPTLDGSVSELRRLQGNDEQILRFLATALRNICVSKVGFEDIIAEPISTHSFDRVWISSHAVFELVKYVFYRILTTFLAIPMAFIAGIVFGILSCIHIWVVMPVIHGCMMTLPSIHVIWTSLMDMFIGPFFFSLGRCLSSINVKTVQN